MRRTHFSSHSQNPKFPYLCHSTAMRPPLLSPKTLLLFTSSNSSPLLVKISHFSTSQSSSSHYSSHSNFSARRHDEESRNVRVSVWWDFENCNLPAGVNVFKVAHTITAAVRTNGIKGPVTITAFGDVLQLSRANQEALSSTGINLTHIPNGGKNSADRSLLVDLMYWVSQNPPPAHLFLISGDRDFASILHRLRMNNYNILLASPESAPGVLCSAASIMWHWHALIRGETLTGKHFNQPPDGPYGSWYGHSKVHLEDPFSVTEQPACSRAEDLPEPSSDSKPRPVPKTVMKLIRHILNSHPKGISITELRSELGKSNVSIDKDLYGYKKFSRFLLSMPHILKLQSGGDGQFVVRGLTPKIHEPFECNPAVLTGPVINNGIQDPIATSKSNGEDRSIAGGVNGKPAFTHSSESNVKEDPKKKQEPSSLDRSITGAEGKSPLPPSSELNVGEPQQHSPLDEKVVESEGHWPPVVEQDSASEAGLFRRVWRKYFGSSDGGSKNKSQSTIEKCSTSGVSSEEKSQSTSEQHSASSNGSEKAKLKEKHAKPTSQEANPICQVPHSSANNDSDMDSKTAIGSEAYGDTSRTNPGFFNKIVNWCKFWRTDPNSDISSDQSSQKLDQINDYSKRHELFSEDSFWSDMESFMGTPNASVIVSHSRTREEMAQNLQNEGPLAHRSLSESDLLHLVDLLISERKWVVECPSQTSPFKLTSSIGKSAMIQSRRSNGLSSIFSGTSPKHDGDLKYQNILHTGISPPAINKKPSVRSRSDILADCQKLVTEILKEYPEGYDMGSFRKLFLERYCYPLDLQKIGYHKLGSLLQVMPGVKIESSYIFPSGKASNRSGLEIGVHDGQESNASHSVTTSDSELSDAAKKDDDFDSPWEELGPVANASSARHEMESILMRKAIEQTERPKYPDYEPSVSDDDFSDSEEETSTALSRPEGQVKKINDEDSSLLQILDSWYSTKEGDNRKSKSENVDGMVDCSTDGLKSSGSSTVGTNSETYPGNYVKKQKPQRTYSFVSDPVDTNKDKLIDGILGCLKKSGETRMQS